MKLVDILHHRHVIHRLESQTTDTVLEEIVQRGLFSLPEEECAFAADFAERMVRALREREAVGSTAIKNTLAIPHGKVSGLKELTAVLGLSDDGVDFGARDGHKSRVFVALFSPQGQHGEHLKALARITRIFSDGNLHRRLLDAADARAAFDELAIEDARY